MDEDGEIRSNKNTGEGFDNSKEMNIEGKLKIFLHQKVRFVFLIDSLQFEGTKNMLIYNEFILKSFKIVDLQDWDPQSLSSIGASELKSLDFSSEVEALMKVEEKKKGASVLNNIHKDTMEKYHLEKIREGYVKALTQIYHDAIDLDAIVDRKLPKSEKQQYYSSINRDPNDIVSIK